MENKQVIRKIKGFYYVVDMNLELECRLKGTLKENNSKFNCIVGDYVEIDENNVIYKVYDRKNYLIRPLISNVDTVFLVYSVVNPEFDIVNLQKNLLYIDSQNIKKYLILTKTDLINHDELNNLKEYILSVYKNIIILLNTQVNEITNIISKNKINVFMGMSGVGKSTLLKKILNRDDIETQEISEKLKRGKNTTVDTRMYKLNNSYIADTPGFSSIDFPEINSIYEVYEYMPDIFEYANCKFRDCNHISSSIDNCGVKNAVENNLIHNDRYLFFKNFTKKG